MPFYFKKGDLVSTKCDALVAASNVNLKMVEGVSRAIFHKAGDKELTNACKAIGHCDVGHSVMTPSFNLKTCNAIIHTVGPIYINGKHNEEKNLRKAYLSALKICVDNNFKTVAFPLLSGEFNYPLRECYEVAEDEIRNFLKDHKDFKIYMVIFKNYPETTDETTHDKLEKYIYNNYDNSTISKDIASENTAFIKMVKDIQKVKNINDEDLAFNSNLALEDLNKYFNDKTLIPSKNIVYSITCGLKATTDELLHLLNVVGYRTYKNDLTGLIVSFAFTEGIYDPIKINSYLFAYDTTEPLGL